MAMAAPFCTEYTEEQVNYFHVCHIYTDILAEGLRFIFKQEWDNRYRETKGEWKDEPQNGLDLWKGESPRSQGRHARHLAIMKNGNRSEWSCSMLLYAILHSDCIHNLNPRVKAEVDDLRKCRNEYVLGVPQGNLSNHKFQIAISKALYTFQALSLPISEIQDVLNRNVEYSEEQLNYFRICHVTVDIMAEGLRSVFKHLWDSRYMATKGEWYDGLRNGLDFRNIAKSSLNRKTDFRSLAKIEIGNRDEWDCITLFYAILDSDCFNDLSEEVRLNVNRLREFRRFFIHMPQGHFSDRDYDIAIRKVCAAFRQLGLPFWQLEDIRRRRFPLRMQKTYKAAYQRALQTGITSDNRVKVCLVGQDRVGKTSVGRSLKGEQFRKDESSTNGVQMDVALKDVDDRPWRNFAEEKETTAFHHKCALYLSGLLSTVTSEGKPLGKEKITKKKAAGTEFPCDNEQHRAQDIKTATKSAATVMSQDTAQPENYGNAVKMSSKTSQETKRQDVQDDIPDQVTYLSRLAIENPRQYNREGIWPVIVDFAGQAVYRAIHPLFTSREAIYVLMFDLTKDLSAPAQCFVKEPGCNEVEIRAPDSNDTNLDHIMRWMDLVHSFKHVDEGKILPPVILVGTHADLLHEDPSVKTMDVKDKICDTTRDFSEHINGKTFAVNNTLAGSHTDEEDPQVVSLRKEILRVGDSMPHTKVEVPLKWLQVEDKVYDLANMGTNYITRQNFKKNICDEICQFKVEDDFEALLNFLHDRGTVVYHGCANDPDSLVILNPEWLVDVLCQIVTVEKQNEENTQIRNLRKDLEENGILDVKLLNDSCERLKLNDIKKSLLAIMKKFNLLCEFTCKEGNPVYLVPCMLTSKPGDKLKLDISENQGPAPVYITFSTQYVPGGLFSRLIVLFVEFAERRVSCDQPKLNANCARFFIGEFTGIKFVCYKRVIQIHVWDHVNTHSNPVEKEPNVCSEVLSFLNISLKRLKGECHWLRAVSWDLCAQCNLCPPETGPCVWHGEQACSHDDCAHYVSLTKKPVRCSRTDGPTFCPHKTWIQALEDITDNKQPVVQTLCTKLMGMDVAPARDHSFATGSKRPAPDQNMQSVATVKVARTGTCTKQWLSAADEPCVSSEDAQPMNRLIVESEVASEKERCYTVGSKREALNQSVPSITPAKVSRLDSDRLPNQDTQLIAPEDVAPPGTVIKEDTPSDDDLEELSDSIAKDWMKLGRRLKISQAKLDAIDTRWPELADKAYRMLLFWKQENGSLATYRVLCNALCHKFVNRRGLAENICFH